MKMKFLKYLVLVIMMMLLFGCGTTGPQGEQGIQGIPGKDGHTPVVTIGENGNWYIDGVDSGIRAEAIKGEDGIGVISIEKTATNGLIDTYTITFTNGETTTFTVTNGKDGATGAQGIQGIQGIPGKDGHTPVITIENGNWHIDGVDTGKSAIGLKGDAGNGISSIKLTNTEGLIDTYTITFTNGQTTTFTVTNGKDGVQGIQGIQGIPGKDGHTPVITIENGNWYIDGVDTGKSASGLKGETGNGISSIKLTNTEGLVDTYTITFTNGETTTFTVTNGKDGNDGAQGIQGIQGIPGKDGHTPVITIENGNWYIDGVDTGKSAIGLKGETGNGISSIKLTNTEGLIDIYTITFTNGQTTTFTVTNGKDGATGAQGIQGIQGIPGKDGHTPVITIENGYWHVDGINTNILAEGLKGETGNGISSIKLTNTEGLIDTYTITFTNGQTTTFTVTNGKDGNDGAQGIQGIQGIPGKDGHTPVITIENGNWYIDGVDTGKSAIGLKGETGNGISSIKLTNTEDLVDTYTITFTNGETTTFTVTNGKDGNNGAQGIQGIQGEPGKDGHTPVITIENGNWHIDGVNTNVLAEGLKGETGNGIASIEKTSTNCLVDTYTITFTNGQTTTFTVTNGKDGDDGAQGIQGIQGEPGKDGHTPVITIENGNWYIDGVDTGKQAQGLKGETGNGISNIEKTSSDGLTDTYTITFTNGQTTTFTVTNGNSGDDGLSAYEIYCKYYDYSKTEEEWISDLVNGNLSNNQKPNKKLTIAVYGDSISTKQNRNAVEIKITTKDVGVQLSAYPTYHDIGTVINGYKITESDIGEEFFFTPSSADVGKTIGKVANFNPSSITTWWEHIEEYFNCNINPVCWSSSSYCSHENNLLRLRNSYSWHDSQIRKLGTRIEGTNERIAPDIVIMYRGCNDMTHSPYAKLTPNYFDDPEWKYPDTDVVEGGWGYKEALSLTIKKIREAYPNTIIVIATQAAFRRIDSDNFPTNNNIYSLPAFNKATREVADFFGCHTIDFDKCGITYENCYAEGYLGDSLTSATHPTNKGHKVMGEQAIYDLIYKLHISPYVPKPIEENKLYEKIAVNHLNGELYEWDEYFSYDFIPVEEGATYYMPNCRNTALLDGYGNILDIIYGPTMEENGFLLSIPKGVKYIRTCARYDTIRIDEFNIVKQDNKFIIYEKRAINGDGTYFDTNDYFAVDLVPVKENVKYYMPNCRNTVFLDTNGNIVLAISGPSMESNGFYVTVPKGATHVRTCARYDTISINEFKVVEVKE